MPRFSIITPNYNGFALMQRYFESLENQTFQDFEVLIVDDCSTDGSYEKLQEYVRETRLQVKLFRAEKNAGPGNARNIGIKNATGEFITFVDNDDWVAEKWLEEIQEVLCANPQVHCVIYDYFIKTDSSESVERSMYRGEGGVCSLQDCIRYARNHTIGKFYKLEDCRDVLFPKLRRCEDVAYVCRAIEACGSVYYLKKPHYYYYQRAISLSNNTRLDEGDMVRAFAVLEESLGEKYPQELKEKSVTDLLYGGLLMAAKSGKSNRQLREYIDRYESKYPGWWSCGIVNEIGKAKKIFLLAAKNRWMPVLKILVAVHTKLVGG